MKNRLLIILSISFGSLLLLAILSFGLVQTDWFQEFLVKRVVIEAQHQGIDVNLKEIKAIAPFKWAIEETSFSLNKGTQVQIRQLLLKIDPLSLLRKNLTIKSFAASEIQIAFHPSLESPNISIQMLKNIQNTSFAIPFDLYIKSMSCEKLSIENLATHQTLTFSLSGRAKIDHRGQEINLDLLLEELETSNRLEIVALSSLKNKNLEAIAEIKITDTKNLSLFFSVPSLPPLELSYKINRKHKNPISFELQGHIDSLNLPNISCFTRPIFIKAAGELSLNPKSSFFLSLKTLQLHDQNITLTSALTFSHEFKPLFADISFAVNELSELSCLLPFQGEVKATIYLDETSFLASIHSPLLTVKNKTFEPVDFHITASKKNNEWTGASNAKCEHPLFPLKESCTFLLKENGKMLETLNFLDLSLYLADAKIGGTANYSFLSHSYDGSFFILAEELRPFRFLFHESELDGKLGGSFSVSGNKEDLNLNLSCLFKNIRYQNSLINTVNMEVKLENLLKKPIGTFSCDAKNIFFRDMILSNVSLHSERTDKEIQTFSLNINGDWKQEIQLQSSGFWKKEGPFWKLELNSCQGSFLSESFSLEQPFSIEKNDLEFLLTACAWKIGSGNLSTQFRLDEKEMILKGEANHIPLGILGVLYPKMAFQGTASFQSSISGPQDHVQGYFFATLEKADFSQNKAKGSLQIHFNPLGAQFYSHLYATKQQFLDCTGTIPLDYSYSPFSWKLNKTRPITSELTMQGAIEDIFDFVNTASHKASGWITSHLFLSGSLTHPALLGSLKCELGSYENYFTGTKLKKIEALIEASSHTLYLSSLKSCDEKTGTLTSEGTLFLSPEKGFPFKLKTELNEMHVVHSDFIEASSTGVLEIIGDKTSAIASGNLTVDKALFKIFDELPYEIPSLPITYINKPIYLQTSTLQTSTPYPLNIDIQLEAKDSVTVQGRGLDSIWNGNVHLSGTVASPAAKGSLTLKKGTFVFSGKPFTLRQGEISFFDKPSPGAYLKINGELPLTSATILAQMQGPLTSPQLTFQAIPALPTSSILSLILFDKDISEISALQALQLAQTIVSLSGKGGPGVLESIRKKIGVDRLNIVGKDGTDEISVQIGWYLSHGITLSLSQSATSSDVTVEVDLKNGFIFQAETQNQEEGKFSFKWNKNY